MKKLPFDCVILDTEDQFIKNRFSGEGCFLTPEAVAVYDTIIGSEMVGRYDLMEKGLEWFQKNFPKEYFILLD